MSDPPLRRLVGQSALVTGSTRSIGRTIAEWLAREGANIVVSGREQDAVEQSVTTMRALGVEAWGIPADLARVSEAHLLAEATLSLVPRLNILVNNAGMSIRGHVWEVSDAEWEEQVNVWCGTGALPQMLPSPLTTGTPLHLRILARCRPVLGLVPERLLTVALGEVLFILR